MFYRVFCIRDLALLAYFLQKLNYKNFNNMNCFQIHLCFKNQLRLEATKKIMWVSKKKRSKNDKNKLTLKPAAGFTLPQLY